MSVPQVAREQYVHGKNATQKRITFPVTVLPLFAPLSAPPLRATSVPFRAFLSNRRLPETAVGRFRSSCCEVVESRQRKPSSRAPERRRRVVVLVGANRQEHLQTKGQRRAKANRRRQERRGHHARPSKRENGRLHLGSGMLGEREHFDPNRRFDPWREDGRMLLNIRRPRGKGLVG